MSIPAAVFCGRWHNFGFITHACGSQGMGKVFCCICEFVYFSVLLKGKWLELSTPKSVEI